MKKIEKVYNLQKSPPILFFLSTKFFGFDFISSPTEKKSLFDFKIRIHTTSLPLSLSQVLNFCVTRTKKKKYTIIKTSKRILFTNFFWFRFYIVSNGKISLRFSNFESTQKNKFFSNFCTYFMISL